MMYMISLMNMHLIQVTYLLAKHGIRYEIFMPQVIKSIMYAFKVTMLYFKT